jgi:hypothetical protein
LLIPQITDAKVCHKKVEGWGVAKTDYREESGAGPLSCFASTNSLICDHESSKVEV